MTTLQLLGLFLAYGLLTVVGCYLLLGVIFCARIGTKRARRRSLRHGHDTYPRCYIGYCVFWQRDFL